MVRVSPERFDELVGEALEGIPDELAAMMENVAVIVAGHHEERDLFGLYEGIPLTRRGPISYGGVLPDRITIYEDTISAHCRDEDALVRQIRKTVIHEVGHHFGISDARLDELGWA